MAEDIRRERARRRATMRRRQIRRRRTVALAILAAVAVTPPMVVALNRGGDSSKSASAITTPSAPAPAPAPAPARPIDLTAVGDTVMGSPPYGLPRDGGASLFTAVAPLLEGDVVLGNFEGTFATGGSSKCGPSPSPNCFAFRTPPSYARWLKRAGFTVMSVANNHSDDFGAAGARQTRRTLASVNVRATGWRGSIAFIPAAGSTVAVIGFAPNNTANSMLDIPTARKLVEMAKARAAVVIVTVHGGAEGAAANRVRPGTETFLGENRGDSLRFAHAVVDAGADLYIGHGPHVLRGMEFYKGRLIAYSLGNFMGYAVFSLRGPSSESGVLQVRLAPDGRFVSGRLRPVTLLGKGVPAPGGTAAATVARLSARDFGARGARVDSRGAITPPAG